jgi:hypothetical protein
MPLPRRGFVKSGVFTAVAAGIAISHPGLLLGQEGKDLFPISMQAQSDPVFSFTQSTFESFVGDTFTVPNARGQMLELKLANVSGYEVSAKTKGMLMRETLQPRTFSMTFTSAAELPKFTSIHKLNHPRLGNFDLFLTATKIEDGTYVYSAVISHL